MKRILLSRTWLIANLAVLLCPFLPFSSGKMIKWLGVTDEWRVQDVTAVTVSEELSVLFSRI